jgi:hypothetical protein
MLQLSLRDLQSVRHPNPNPIKGACVGIAGRARTRRLLPRERFRSVTRREHSAAGIAPQISSCGTWKLRGTAEMPAALMTAARFLISYSI